MRKAPGVCDIVPEMLKAGGEVMVEVKMFNLKWRKGVVSVDWKNAEIIYIYKKGSRLDCANSIGRCLDLVKRSQESWKSRLD